MRENTRVTPVKPFCSYDLISQEDNSPPQAEMSPSNSNQTCEKMNFACLLLFLFQLREGVRVFLPSQRSWTPGCPLPSLAQPVGRSKRQTKQRAVLSST